jgi:hypothetical protein
LALAKAGNNNAARMAIMAITTRSSMSVNPRFLFITLPDSQKPSQPAADGLLNFIGVLLSGLADEFLSFFRGTGVVLFTPCFLILKG